MGSKFRMFAGWLVVTASVVAGVDVATSMVARDVGITRPAPMTPSDVSEQLRGDDPGTTTVVAPPTGSSALTSTSTPTTSSSPAPTSPRPPTTSHSGSPTDSAPSTSVLPPEGSSTTAAGPPVRQDERGDPTGP